VTTPVTDPVERAARIIAGIENPGLGWDDLRVYWQDRYRQAAQAVLDDLASRTETP